MEKNCKILDEALQQLRSYVPDGKVWDALQSQLAEAAMAHGLSKLKSIDPPQHLWNTIPNELDKQEKIHQIKAFTPGDEIWNRIDESLDADAKKRLFARIFRRTSWAAAAAILILTGYFLIIQTKQAPNIAYSLEIVETENPGLWRSDDNEIRDVLTEICTSNPLACESPGFKEKTKELAYLDEQKTEILNNLNAYGQNKHLEVMLTKIELEKNEIVKQLISEIL
ncbi:MAG: hypothetical protein EOM83_13180 [Clostridia bacterium]|nr:hypothetical protein [Clostridia bacterium]